MSVPPLVMHQLGTDASSPKNRSAMLFFEGEKTTHQCVANEAASDQADSNINLPVAVDSQEIAPVKQIGTDASSPKNRTFMFCCTEDRGAAYYYGPNTWDDAVAMGEQNIVDGYNNAYSNQKMRGGIGG